MAKKILVVDDSMVARMFLKKLIHEKEPSWNVSDAANATDALEVFQKEGCDIASIDFNMPDSTGLELATKIRQKGPETVIVILTANIQHSLRKKVEEAGFIFLEKPITEETVDFLIKL